MGGARGGGDAAPRAPESGAESGAESDCVGRRQKDRVFGAGAFGAFDMRSFLIAPKNPLRRRANDGVAAHVRGTRTYRDEGGAPAPVAFSGRETQRSPDGSWMSSSTKSRCSSRAALIRRWTSAGEATG